VNKRSKVSSKRSIWLIVVSWVGDLLSVGLLVVLGRVVVADFGGFRSCNNNSSGLSISTCGKQSLNPGDWLLLLLFCLTACLVVSLFTYAWRLSRSRSQK
jgi:hypothetical protein